jgi:uncharacterized protein with beta-barrel porin domain
MHISKNICFTILFLTLCLFPALPALAVDETYAQAITQAISNAGGTGTVASKWLASSSSIISINSSDTHGLIYDSGGNLVVRTAANYASWMDSFYVQSNYNFKSTTPPTNDSAAWVTTGNDCTQFLTNQSVTAANVITTLERGLGMNITGSGTPHNVMIEYTVTPDNSHLMRPTKNPDITTYNKDQYGNADTYTFSQPSGMTSTTYANYSGSPTFTGGFYQNHVTASYAGVGTFPYTQLGYTYFWGNGPASPTELSQIQGMTEFIFLPQTLVNVYGIYAMQSYIYTRNKSGVLSADSDAQYGNGFASFHITGNCDSIWAGHRFQALTRTSPSNPNTITIDSGYTVSDGQGLLIWSLNYNVTNNGTISGATTNKIGTSGTANVAVLFEGDTIEYGGISPSGINSLTNNGTISSPGTAVMIEGGDSTVTNNSGATISGTTTAILIEGGTTTITNNGTITGAITLTAGTTAALNAGAGNIAFTGAYNQNSGTTLKFTANSAASYGKITPTAASTLDAASKVILTTAGYIPNNTTFKAVDTSGAGVGVDVPGTITATSPIFSVTGSNSTKDLILTATRANTYNSFASNSNVAAAGSVLNTLAADNTATGDMVTVLGALDSLTSGSQIDQALNSLLPNTDNSAPQTTQATLDQFLSTVFAHLDAVKNVTAAALNGQDVWTSGYGSYIHQDPMGTSNGYNATIWGTALGYDFPALDHLRAGLSGGFAQDFVRTKDSSARTDINSCQGTLYGSYARDAYYIDTAFSFVYNTYDASRHVAVGSIDRTASGKYNGQQYSAYIGGGYKFTGKNIELTPLASFQYTHLRLNSYTESGADAADLNIDAQDYDFAQTGLGMKFGYPVNLRGGTGRLTPELKFKWLYDWVGDAQQATSTFTGGGGSFSTQGFTPAQSSYDFGAKLTLETVNFITLSLSYDLELKEGFYGHYGLVEARYRF